MPPQNHPPAPLKTSTGWAKHDVHIYIHDITRCHGRQTHSRHYIHTHTAFILFIYTESTKHNAHRVSREKVPQTWFITIDLHSVRDRTYIMEMYVVEGMYIYVCSIYKCALRVLGWVWNIESVRASTGGVRLGCVSLMGRNGEGDGEVEKQKWKGLATFCKGWLCFWGIDGLDEDRVCIVGIMTKG